MGDPDHQSGEEAVARVPAPRGRGAGFNPTNRFESLSLRVLPEHVEEVVSQNPDGTTVRTMIYADRTRTAVNAVDSPDIRFRWSINPYRGCEHGCVYCYARPYHEYLGWSSGLDFETRIVAKFDAPELVRKHLARPGWTGETIVMSGVTDPYQPVEARLEITRRILEVMLEHHQPVSLITKNRLITRDLDLLSALARVGAVHAAVSVTSLDNRIAAAMEPRASAPRDRLEAISALSCAGVPVRAMIAPIIPGLNDREIPALLAAVKEAGAVRAGFVLLRLPYQVKDLFLEWLDRRFPDRRARVEALIRDTRGGALYRSTPGERQTGRGAVARVIADTFELFARKHGLLDAHPEQAWGGPESESRASPFRPPSRSSAPGRDTGETGQLPLF